jgi:NAD(P)-dependent dehydrogenase (short-subunit alcohol dehydrogenase family)
MTYENETAIVTGGSRGLGRGVVEALASKGMRVLVIARDKAALEKLSSTTGARVEAVVGDASDELLAAKWLQSVRPNLVVLCAGHAPLLRPIHHQSWDTFSRNWEMDTKMAFVWLRHALLLPLAPRSQVIVISSMAGVRGSPMSGGYAGAKRTQQFIAEYAAEESERLGLGLRIRAILPMLNPSTDLGRDAIRAYAERASVTVEEFEKRLGPPVTPQTLGRAVLDLYLEPDRWERTSYALSGQGLAPIP